MPAPFVDQPPYDPGEHLDYCPTCTAFHWKGLGHHCQAKPRMSWTPILHSLLLLTTTALVILLTLTLARHA